MKKILFSFFILVMSFGAFGATFNCQKQKLPGGKAENSNEYLYVSISDHEQDNAFVCGHLTTSGCNSDYYIYVRGDHYWKGSSVSGAQLYSCDYQKGWGDAWVQTGFGNLDPCESTEGRAFVTTINGNKKVYTTDSYSVHPSSDYIVTKGFCYIDEVKVQPVVEQTCEQSHCSGVSGDVLTKCRACCAAENEITWNGSDCSCKDVNKNFDVSTRRCVARQGDREEKSCREGRTTAEGKACCDLPEDVATWDDPNCNCLGGKEFKIDGQGKGQCVVSGGGDDEGNAVTPYKCSDFDITLINSWKVDCKDSSTVMQLIQQFELKCKDPNLTVAEFNKMSNQVSLAVERSCQPVIEEVIKPDNSQARAAIISAGGVLDSIVAGFGKSKWKNAEGEFNTARLASDSIAAVVLGTAGGLITSSVMKKHQVEDGFEDLKCVIGGQPVAGWGDEFRVGIQ